MLIPGLGEDQYLMIHPGPGRTGEGVGSLDLIIFPVIATGWYSVTFTEYLSPWHASARAQSMSSWVPEEWEKSSWPVFVISYRSEFISAMSSWS